MKRYLLLLGIFSYCFAQPGFAQEEILFSVEKQDVPLEEFLYIYEKTNRDQADFSRASIMEYLDLYKKFKLKVKKARDMQLDTISALQQELAGYRKQLANTYLNDKEVLDGLVRELHERMQHDVNFSHILLRLPPGANEEATEAIYQKALDIREKLRDGADFDSLALAYSEDPSVRQNRGNIGFITAPMSDGFYEVESTLYSIPANTYSRPVRSKLGFHILTVKGKRQARGEIEVRQIMARGKDGKAKIDQIYQQLQDGADFEETARNVSDDKKTAPRGGYIQRFGINKYESIFESTAFRLKNDGDFSEPIKTSLGWHIIQRVRHYPIGPLENVRRSLESKVKQDERFAIAEASMVDRIRDENNYVAADWDKEALLSQIGENFRTYKWEAPKNLDDQKLFTIGGQHYTTADFVEYLSTNTAERLRVDRIQSPTEALTNLYDKFEESRLLAFEESRLDEKYPEFKALMREYSEGILLFEATKMKVWDRASEDSVGLQAFYQANKQNYLWPPRAEVESLTINTTEEGTLNKIYAQLSKRNGAKLKKKFNKNRELIQTVSTMVDQDKLDPDLEWKEGSISDKVVDEQRDRVILKRVVRIVEPKPKSLDEARGYIIADYQDHLEKQWIDSLMEEYEISINDQVLESIIRS